ncbi:MAG: glycogen debranching enzyme N-terminal domain-containing protein [Armatimonadetes bacterium]|nr:glycogen debranching enzyme N-terminal domain-containing protein [Armatimonadota bacterium]
MVLGPAELDSLESLRGREWVETDGLGSYASSTVAGIHTRRRHAWLAAAGRDGQTRVLLAKFEEAAFVDGMRHDLGANQYSDVVHPEGYRYLSGFRLDPWPVWTYRLGCAVLERHLALLHGSQTLVIVYHLVSAPTAVSLELRPLVAGRAIDQTRGENSLFDRGVRSRGEQLELVPYERQSRLVLTWPGANFMSDGYWYYQFQYRLDGAREDLFSPGLLLTTLHEGERMLMAASTAPLDGLDLDVALSLEADRRRRLAAACRWPADEAASRLALSADQWVQHRRRHNSIGALWLDAEPPSEAEVLRFLPGLALLAGRADLASEMLLAAPVGLWTAWVAERLGLAEALRPAVEAWVRSVRDGVEPGLRETEGWLESLDGTWSETNLLWRASLRLAGDEAAETTLELRRRWPEDGSPLLLCEPGLLDDEVVRQALARGCEDDDPWPQACYAQAAKRLGMDWRQPDLTQLREGLLGQVDDGDIGALAGLMWWLSAAPQPQSQA